MLLSGRSVTRFSDVNKTKGTVKHMNQTNGKETLLLRVLRCVGCILLSVLLLLATFSCAKGAGEDPQGSASAETDGVSDPIGDTVGETNKPSEPESTAPGKDESASLLYYVSLIEELQEEIRALKAENFILSAALAEKSENETVSSDTSLPFTYEIDDGEVTILTYTGSETTVTVPDTVEGYPVTEIGEKAFARSRVVSVTLPDTVEEIDWFAFSECVSLKTVTVGSALSEIGYGAFDGCSSALTLVCKKGSYTEQYAKSFGIAVKNP